MADDGEDAGADDSQKSITDDRADLALAFDCVAPLTSPPRRESKGVLPEWSTTLVGIATATAPTHANPGRE